MSVTCPTMTRSGGDLRYGGRPAGALSLRLQPQPGRFHIPAGKPYPLRDYMAATKKSSKRSAGKKRGAAKRSTARKRPKRKTAAKRRTKARATKATKLKRTAKRTARKGLRAARGGIKTVRKAGEKTWEALKSTTAQVVGGVREKLGESNGSDRNLSSR